MKRALAGYLVGIDEAGRGPLAGPVAVGAVSISARFEHMFNERFENIRDSKKLSEQKREIWFKSIVGARNEGLLDFRVSLISPKVIDSKGINYAIQRGISSCLRRLGGDKRKTFVLLDGGIYAPEGFSQQTIIKGDSKEKLIMCAAMIAKVTRDRHMRHLGEKYPEYGFDNHKGYGTTEHMKILKRKGTLPVHRKTFVKEILRKN